MNLDPPKSGCCTGVSRHEGRKRSELQWIQRRKRASRHVEFPQTSNHELAVLLKRVDV